jgi:hypothetical protein
VAGTQRKPVRRGAAVRACADAKPANPSITSAAQRAAVPRPIIDDYKPATARK